MRDDIYAEVARASRLQRLEVRYKGFGALLIAVTVCLSVVLTFTIGLQRVPELITML